MAGFKRTLFGFSKKDVTKFITKLSSDYSSVIKEKDDEIELLKAEIKDLNKKIKDLEKVMPQKETYNADE